MKSLDHIAFRTKDKWATANFFIQNLGYSHRTSFELDFEDDGKVECLVLSHEVAPEIFISDGEPNTVVGKWVLDNGEGPHHLAFKTNTIDQDVKEMKEKKIEFTSEILKCDDLRQIFTKPQKSLGGLILELIERKSEGFCLGNTKALMESTKQLQEGHDG